MKDINKIKYAISKYKNRGVYFLHWNRLPYIKNGKNYLIDIFETEYKKNDFANDPLLECFLLGHYEIYL